MKTAQFSPISNVTITGARTTNFQAILIDQIYGYAIQAVWTGTGNGELKLQGSCTPIPRSMNISANTAYPITTWTDIEDSNRDVPGTAGNAIWNIKGSMYNFIRIVYTQTSGTLVLNANMVVKGA